MLGYQWDSLGNLQHRTSQRVNSSGSQIENFSERFSYDTLNRLQYAETSGTSIVPRARDYEYDAYGNMTHNGVGSQQYAQTNGASIYGVTRANNKDYRYDSYGNVTSRGTTNVEYNVFNKPTRIGDTQFWYDANHQKVKQQTGTKVTYFYAGGAYEVENNNGTLTTTLRVGNYLQKKTGTAVTEEYHLYDHLGSTDVITDANGNAVSRMAFDGFGKRLQDTFASANSTANGSSTYKGYTGHDMLDHLGLIHMGGRVYDPDAGRFLSADLFVQAPGNSQSYNRYSYVLNNPLSLIDPTGYKGRSAEDTATKSDKIVEEVVKDGAKAAERERKLLNMFIYNNVQAAIHLGGGYVLYSPALAARLDRLDRHARNGITGAARQAAKIRQQISNSTKKNGAGLGLGGQQGIKVVNVSPGLGLGAAGHTFLGVGGKGYTTAINIDGVGQGDLETMINAYRADGWDVTLFTIEASGSMDANTQLMLNSYDPGTYVPIGNNCSDFVVQVLNDVGLLSGNLSTLGYITPAGSFNSPISVSWSLNMEFENNKGYGLVKSVENLKAF